MPEKTRIRATGAVLMKMSAAKPGCLVQTEDSPLVEDQPHPRRIGPP